jgi:AcrR family transcriptional regulator
MPRTASRPAPARHKPGLRERKKAKTRTAIQTEALRLFKKQGYQATTIEQIIAAADVSESTLFRYFPTKEDLVLHDEYDPLIIDALRAQPPEIPPITAIRAALGTMFGGLSEHELAEQRERLALVLSVPDLRSRMLDQYLQAARLLAAVIAEREGRRPDEFAVRVIAGAVIGAFMAGLDTIADDPDADFGALIDRALAQLEGGLTL